MSAPVVGLLFLLRHKGIDEACLVDEAEYDRLLASADWPPGVESEPVIAVALDEFQALVRAVEP